MSDTTEHEERFDSEKLRDTLRKSPSAVAEFLVDLYDSKQELSLSDALRWTIAATGVEEFCSISELKKSQVDEFLESGGEGSPDLLNSFLKKLGLRAELTLRTL